jgi:isopenicillin-N epimerase
MWALEQGTHHLNHGSFGAVLQEVLELQDEWRRNVEANPTRFFLRELQPAIDRSRDALAKFVGAEPGGIVPVRNATSGVASVLHSIEPDIRPGDQLLTTAHDYNAVRQILEFTALRSGAEVVVVEVPFPIDSPGEVTKAVTDRVTERTRLAVIDHVTSSTALLFPIYDIVASLEPQTPVLIDGAHGPGQVSIEIDRLGASWYTGNLHKWTCAPKGAAFLHTRSDRREMTVPHVISHGHNALIDNPEDRYQLRFDWLGTDDLSAWGVMPDALDIVGGLDPGGWEAVMKRNHELTLYGRRVIADAVGTELPAPDEMIGSMATIPLPDGVGPDPGGDLSPLMGNLIDRGFVTLVMNWPTWPRQMLRISSHVYNSPDEYRDLADALRS